MVSNFVRFGFEVDFNLLMQVEVLVYFDVCVDFGVIKFDGDFIIKLYIVDGIDVSDYVVLVLILEIQGIDYEKFEFCIF